MFIKKDHLKVVAKIAWSFNKTTGIEFEELYSEGCLALCEAIPEYDPDKDCKLTTFIYRRVQNHLINTVKRYGYVKEKFQAIPAEETGWEYGEDDPIIDFNEDLSKVISTANKDVQQVINLVLQKPEIYGRQKSKFARGQIRNDLRELGWTWERIWKTIRDTKFFINENLNNCII
jgi:RNA polymerase primary sigma factor